VITALDRLQRLEDGLSGVTERLEARLRAVEDRLLQLEGLEKVVVARAAAEAKVAASDAATDRLERIFDRLARIEARLPPPAGG
jgi:hypothetical protein